MSNICFFVTSFPCFFLSFSSSQNHISLHP
uniref:Uncharacterized protein n=1 Tax=Anguilla anguilla TaxID=7936 RepID=A0A0E9RIU6_ANGAN